VGRRVAAQLGLGLIAGAVCTLLWDRLFDSGLAKAATADPVSLLIVGGVLALVAAVACAVPIRRATRLDPLASMRRA
jgi:ABC-type antimicrobial peptide transport system permease subunit